MNKELQSKCKLVHAFMRYWMFCPGFYFTILFLTKHPISYECVNQFTFWLKFLLHISVISNNRCLNSNSVLWLLSWVARILKDTSVFLGNFTSVSQSYTGMAIFSRDDLADDWYTVYLYGIITYKFNICSSYYYIEHSTGY